MGTTMEFGASLPPGSSTEARLEEIPNHIRITSKWVGTSEEVVASDASFSASHRVSVAESWATK